MTEALLSEHKNNFSALLFTVTTTVLSVTVCFNQMRSVNFNSETIKLVILQRRASGQQMSETA